MTIRHSCVAENSNTQPFEGHMDSKTQHHPVFDKNTLDLMLTALRPN